MKYYKVNESGEIEGVAIDRKFISRSEAEKMFPNQPKRSKREDSCECIQCKLDKYHQEHDPDFYRFQKERRKTSWCPTDNLLDCQKTRDAVL